MERAQGILVVDCEERTRCATRDELAARGYRVLTAATAAEGLRLLGAGAPCDALVLSTEGDGLSVLELHRAQGGAAPAVIVGEAGAAAEAAAADGIVAFVARGLITEELPFAVARVIEQARAALAQGKGPAALPATGAPRGRVMDPNAFVSASAAMREVFELVDRVANAAVPVLIRGESGVGKEVVARAVHARSRRHAKVFVKINCAALPSELLESELFGHEKGAFTGAHQEKPGKFELADGGTIFLDELGEMPPSLQAKLLQVLQDEEFYRVGGKRPLHVDARVVVATNRELEKEIERGGFREDLYYRLNVVGIRVPSLRERKEDIVPLVAHFCRKYGEHGELVLSAEVLRRFQEHDWPGNVRELENMVRRLVVLGDERLLLSELSARGIARGESSLPPPALPAEGLKDISRRAAMLAEREAIDQTLKVTGWNKRRAAAALKISYKALLYKIKECGLVDPRLLHLGPGPR